ncbi:FxSxx-COOH system tetratricopeptide repeat protein [Actinomadura sp. ATCC 31491]|uniref:FxSxx-COOH system tetratricopeptide repeat protein n=1 Tax=Actinomadura luzonensis TaxID=2805427 RepID=A0ABT0FPT9_9ACTN|nr:FxSxx-COOH system tetratricopeptide repeat protein [Actinomadura luzonensis]MCK2214325.1 FxSxx-COOH system tetratricopeptide repeat protein [Actinomadura luzonensis]
MAGTQPGEGRRSTAPEVWGRVPPRNKNFTGRQELLEKLRAGMTAEARGQVTVVIPQVLPHALHGLGGVGKTQMAVEYAYRYRGEYDLVWWISADQRVLIRSSLASLAPHLGLPDAAAIGVEDAANAALDALRRGKPYDRWLLIFDNADEPEEILDIIPNGPGHVLITSRNHRWEDVVEAVPVDVFAREESVAFLSKRIRRAIAPEDADRLAEQLGDLPLALEQAGALQAETGMPVDEYIELLNKHTSQLLDEGKPTEYPISMTAAWNLSVSRLSERRPEAVDLLRCCAFFGPEPIPRDVFSQRGTGLSPGLAELLDNPIKLSRSMGELGRFALARIDPGSRTIQVHRLIQALVRDELDPEERATHLADVHHLLTGLDLGNPDESVNWGRYGGVLAHVVPSRLQESQDARVRDFALSLARYLFMSSDGYAQEFVNLFIHQWEKDSGPDDPHVLRAYREQGNILRQLGRYNEVYELNQKTLAKMRRVGTPDDELLLLVSGIGGDLRARGDFAAALEHDEDSVRRHAAAFGPGDHRTLRAKNNLGLDYCLTSRFEQARELHENTLLEIRDTKSGAATIVGCWNALARAVRLNGDYAEACDIGEEVLAYGLEYLGGEHPMYLYTAKDLSIAWRRLGELDKALEMSTDVHGRYVRRYGLDHPDTLASAMSLANVQRNNGQEQEGLELATDTVNRYPRVYGTNHPYYLTCQGNLALLYRTCQEPAKARELNEETLHSIEQRLGRNHHYYLTVATNLASDLAALGQYEAAVERGRDTHRRLVELVGENHPMALACAANLSIDLKRLGTPEAVEEGALLREDTRSRYAQRLGLEHPDAAAFLAERHLDLDFDPPPI